MTKRGYWNQEQGKQGAQPPRPPRKFQPSVDPDVEFDRHPNDFDRWLEQERAGRGKALVHRL